MEQFTSPIGKSDLAKIKKMTAGEFKPAKRWLVEDGNEILKNARRRKGGFAFLRRSHTLPQLI